jgi:hypothetical protein
VTETLSLVIHSQLSGHPCGQPFYLLNFRLSSYKGNCMYLLLYLYVDVKEPARPGGQTENRKNSVCWRTIHSLGSG